LNGATVLEGIPLFSGLGQEELEQVERQAVRKRYRANTVFIEQGDDANNLYFLIQGRVKILIAGDDGKEIILGEKGPGSYVGELALLGEGKRTASVQTLEDSQFLVLSRQSFESLLRTRPDIALSLLHDLAKKVRSLSDDLSDFALLDVYGRMTKLLRNAAIEEGARLITPPLTHQDIADRIGASREMVSKILKDLRAGGYVDVIKKRIILRKDLPAKW
jgi:CRP/FNR family cyclic AMP-dependent transcriptional regulator